MKRKMFNTMNNFSYVIHAFLLACSEVENKNYIYQIFQSIKKLMIECELKYLCQSKQHGLRRFICSHVFCIIIHLFPN